MEFADGQCYLCGRKFGIRKPKTESKIDKPYKVPSNGRIVEYVSPCPFCGENVPLCVGSRLAYKPEPEPPESKLEPES